MRRHGFARADLASAIVMLAIAAALILCAGRQMRQQQMTASSLSQLRWIAGATASYAADNGDRFWSFSWTAGPTPSAYPDLQFASSNFAAVAMQATDILRRRSGRDDLPLPGSWLPHPLYNHLPLVDYLGEALPAFKLIAPADKYRLAWARDPAAFDRGEFLPFQPDPSDLNKRWVYTPSYQIPAAMWDLSDVGLRISQAATHQSYAVPAGAIYAGAAIDDARFPSQKVMVHDMEQRTLGPRPLYCVEEAARTATLMADGAAGIRPTRSANYGWLPNRPTSVAWTRYQYAPSPWEAPTSTGEPGVRVDGHYRWTRGGILGRDFGGPEIDTGQP
ncbi:MAG: hypothetical protein ACF8R7_02430 [Phycisphaerales bacterium JB039]